LDHPKPHGQNDQKQEEEQSLGHEAEGPLRIGRIWDRRRKKEKVSSGEW
jgi:hypothetical protein